MKILTVLVVLLVAYWTKNRLLTPKLSEPIEIFPSGASTFVKKTIRTHSYQSPKAGNRRTTQQDDIKAVNAEFDATNKQVSQAQVSLDQEMPAAVVNEQIAADVQYKVAPQRIPEDSVQKRHFMAQLKADIEKQHAPSPSDAVLQRHHRQLVNSRIQTYLADNK